MFDLEIQKQEKEAYSMQTDYLVLHHHIGYENMNIKLLHQNPASLQRETLLRFSQKKTNSYHVPIKFTITEMSGR